MRIRNDVALAGLAVVLGLVAACSSSSDMTSGGKGAVQIVMSATSPAAANQLASSGGAGARGDRAITGASATFAAIEARNLDGQLIDVTIELPATVDLVGLVTDGAVTLPAGFLPPGTYDQLVIVISSLQLTLANGTIVTIDPPGGGWTAVIGVTEPFEVAEGTETIVNVVFRGDRSFRLLNGNWEFDPHFECGGQRRGGNDD